MAFGCTKVLGATVTSGEHWLYKSRGCTAMLTLQYRYIVLVHVQWLEIWKWCEMAQNVQWHLGAMVMEVYMLCNCTGYDCGCAITMDVWDVQ